MTTTRYFEVKVTGCKDCPFKDRPYGEFVCNHPEGYDSLLLAQLDFKQNYNQLTDSCPMAAQHKESETK